MAEDFEEKRRRLGEALERGIGQVHLDARRPGVLVPARFAQDFHLVLNFSHHFAVDDLALSEWGVRQSLSFGGVRTSVGVPWSAVYAVSALATQELWLFPRDMPKEMLEGAVERQREVTEPARPGAGDGTNPATAALRAVLRPVPTAPEAASGDDGETPAPAPAPVAPPATAVAAELTTSTEAASPDAERTEADAGPRPPRRGHLRLVK